MEIKKLKDLLAALDAITIQVEHLRSLIVKEIKVSLSVYPLTPEEVFIDHYSRGKESDLKTEDDLPIPKNEKQREIFLNNLEACWPKFDPDKIDIDIVFGTSGIDKSDKDVGRVFITGTGSGKTDSNYFKRIWDQQFDDYSDHVDSIITQKELSNAVYDVHRVFSNTFDSLSNQKKLIPESKNQNKAFLDIQTIEERLSVVKDKIAQEKKKKKVNRIDLNILFDTERRLERWILEIKTNL